MDPADPASLAGGGRPEEGTDPSPRERYLRAPVPPGVFVGMAAKYGALLDALYQAEPLRSRLLGRVARDHTGALRECQLVTPKTLLLRYRTCIEQGRRPARSRAHHLSGAAAAVVLWRDLHLLLRAQLVERLRREAPYRRKRYGALPVFTDHLTARVRRSSVLGVPDVSHATVGGSTTDAYAHLAYLVGVSRAQLAAVLRSETQEPLPGTGGRQPAAGGP